MFRKSTQSAPPRVSRTIEERLQSLFGGGDGFGLILYFWALMGSLISAVTLVAIGVAFGSWWAVFLGLIALRCYAYVGRIGQEHLDKMMPYDG